MTSATVTQLGEMISNISSSTNSSEMQNGEFAGIFQTAADKSSDVQVQEAEPVKTSATEKSMGGSKTADKLRDNNPTETEVEPKDMDAAEQELEKAVVELKTEIAEKLDITVEELEEVMETLGLTDASLFTPEGMTTLVMEIEQISTPVELLTNADAYQVLQELNATAENLFTTVQNEHQLTDAQMQEVLQQFETTEKFEVSIEVSEPVEENSQDVVVTETKVQEVRNADNLQTVKDADDLQEVQEVVDEVPETKQGENETNVQKTVDEATTVKETEFADAKQNGAEHSKSEGNASQNHMMAAEGNAQYSNTQVVNQTNVEYVQNLFEGNVTTQEIYDQIGDYIKTHVRPGISEVEMQLNPESLGSLHIHLSSKQGNVTAQFVVQNEAVKAALEIQMIQLKENFAEQGIKVDAVEVTVESHSFNNNMQQNSNGEAQAQTEAKRSGIRNINLNENWTEEELTEEEQLVAEMMEANGNTVDFMA